MRRLRKLVSALVLATLLAAGQAAPTEEGAKSAQAQPGRRYQCIAKTKQGTRCRRRAQPGGRYCWQHDPARAKPPARH